MFKKYFMTILTSHEVICACEATIIGVLLFMTTCKKLHPFVFLGCCIGALFLNKHIWKNA